MGIHQNIKCPGCELTGTLRLGLGQDHKFHTYVGDVIAAFRELHERNENPTHDDHNEELRKINATFT